MAATRNGTQLHARVRIGFVVPLEQIIVFPKIGKVGKKKKRREEEIWDLKNACRISGRFVEN